MEATYIIKNDRVKANCLTAVASIPDGWVVSIRKPGKSNAQRSYWHMAVGLLGEHSGYTLEQAKYLIKEAVLGVEKFTDKKGKDHYLVPSSESLSKEDYSRLIDYTLIAAGKVGCVIPPPHIYGLER